MRSVGIDLLEVNRLSKISENQTKISKIFTRNEQLYFQKFVDKLPHMAGCFCAKEAVAKALKCGFGATLSLLDVEVLHQKNGAPFINTSNSKLKNFLKNNKIEISISHTQNYATAICIII